MQNFLRINLVAIIALFAFSNLYYVSEFDGQWKANISTEKDKCAEGFGLDLQIQKGQIFGAYSGKNKMFQLQGDVDSGGRFHLSVVGTNKKGLQGIFKESSGEARWNYGECSDSLITLNKQ